MRGRTITIPVKGNPRAKYAEKWLDQNCQASTGPHPCITGMRKLYWGMDALIVKLGAYIYYMGKDKGQEIPF